MHVAFDHTRISRDFVKKSLEERRPALLNLPLPVPSIPIVAPILTHLVGGNNKPSPTPQPPAPPAPTPTPSPPSSPPPSNGGDSGNGNGNGNGGDNGNGNGNSDGNGSGDGNNGGGSGDGGSSGGNTGGSDTGSGNNGGDASNSGGGNSGSGTGNNGDSTNTGSSSPEQTGSSGNPGNSNASSSGSSGTNDASESSGSSNDSQSGDGGNSSQNGGGGAVGNAGTDPNQTNAGHGLKSALGSGTEHGSPNATGTSNPGINGSGGNGGSGSGGSGANGGSGGISKGAIAAIAVIGILALLGLLVCLLRRRAIARRSDRRNRWWGKKETTTPQPQYGDGIRNSVDSTNSRTVSVRSSFATTFDHGQAPRLTMDFESLPPVPPMAEIRNGPVAQGQLFSPANDTPILVSFDNSHVTPEARYSTHSISSNTSDGYSQYLVVANSGLMDSPEIRTPMSVRPFSPSESFAFPKPPNVQSGDWSNAGSRPQSSSTLVTLRSPEISYIGSPVPPTPALPKDPFADPSKAEISAIETICRPFIPTLGDELGVAIGDSVKVVNIFDDGWAMVEKIPEGSEVPNPRSGLIPIDCLRAVDQDLPAFMSERRVSIPYADSANGHSVMAL